MPYDIKAILKMTEEAEQAEPQIQPAEQEQRVVLLPVEDLQDFPAALHKFKPATGQRLSDLEKSIRENGILNAILVRKLPDGQYQIIAGHNRRTAAQNIGYRTVPCIVKELPEDDDAIRAMIADNMNNRELLPSERGWAYCKTKEGDFGNNSYFMTDMVLAYTSARSAHNSDIGSDIGANSLAASTVSGGGIIFLEASSINKITGVYMKRRND